jgi:hypothetical protein
MGRPPDLEKRAQQQEAFLSVYARIGLVGAALKEVGLHMPAHYRWLEADADYAQRFAELEQESAGLAKLNRKPHPRGYRIKGSRVELRHQKQEAMLAALAKCGILEQAAAEANTTVTSFHTWCREDETFAARAREARVLAEPERQRLMHERAGAAATAIWSDPGRREAQRERQQNIWTPEMRAAAGQRNHERLADPAYRAQWLAKSRASREFVACENPWYFDQIDTPEKAYWLGFIATDGCVRGFNSGSLRLVIKLARKDRDHLVLLHEALKAKRPIRDVEEWAMPPQSTERRLRPYSVLDVCSPQIVNALVSQGITPRKTNTLQSWDGPAALMPHYWRGVIDGDGTISISDQDIKIGLCGSVDLVEAFRAWAESICGTTAKARRGDRGGRNYWLLYIGGMRQVPVLLYALYENAPVALARKKALADLAVHGKPLQATIF